VRLSAAWLDVRRKDTGILATCPWKGRDPGSRRLPRVITAFVATPLIIRNPCYCDLAFQVVIVHFLGGFFF